MADDLNRTYDDAKTGRNAAVNVVVMHQGLGKYEVIQLEVTPEQSAQIHDFETLQGRALDHAKLQDAGLNVDENQRYYAFGDISKAVMDHFTLAHQEAKVYYNELANEAGQAGMDTARLDIDVHDHNGIRNATDTMKLRLDTIKPSAISHSDALTDFGKRREINHKIDDVMGRLHSATDLALGISRIDFSFNKPNIPGTESIEPKKPDYDQFRKAEATSGGTGYLSALTNLQHIFTDSSEWSAKDLAQFDVIVSLEIDAHRNDGKVPVFIGKDGNGEVVFLDEITIEDYKGENLMHPYAFAEAALDVSSKAHGYKDTVFDAISSSVILSSDDKQMLQTLFDEAFTDIEEHQNDGNPSAKQKPEPESESEPKPAEPNGPTKFAIKPDTPGLG